MQIVILDGYGLNPGDLSYDGFGELGEVTCYEHTPEELVVSRIGMAEAVIINKIEMTRAVFEACPNLRYVGVMATGYNVVDLAAAREHGVTVTNVPGYGTPSVAQFTFSLMLAIANHVEEHSASVFAGDWVRSVDFCYWKTPLTDLAGKTLGLVGFGAIGQAVARIAQAFDMEVIYFNRSRKPQAETAHCRFASLDEVLAQADILSLHSPLTEETKDLICRKTIHKMKPSAWLINTARGGMVVEEDLAEALKEGRLAYAALDVIREEPMPADCPLLSAPNLLITPHIAWASLEARKRLLKIGEHNLAAFLAGSPENVVQ